MARLPTLHSDMAARIRLSQSAAEVRGVISICLQGPQEGRKQPCVREHVWRRADRACSNAVPTSGDVTHTQQYAGSTA
jgi:hypothetical protein